MERTNSRQPQCAMNITFNPEKRELNEHPETQTRTK